MSTCTKTFLWQRLLHFPINGYKIEKPVLAVLGVSKNCTILHKKEYYKLQKIAHQYNSLDVIKKGLEAESTNLLVILFWYVLSL